jgi:hypothetical protein
MAKMIYLLTKLLDCETCCEGYEVLKASHDIESLEPYVIVAAVNRQVWQERYDYWNKERKKWFANLQDQVRAYFEANIHLIKVPFEGDPERALKFRNQFIDNMTAKASCFIGEFSKASWFYCQESCEFEGELPRYDGFTLEYPKGDHLEYLEIIEVEEV